MTRLSVLVVTHNAAARLDRLLDGPAHALKGLDAEVVLVDSASHDGTADAVCLRHAWVRLVRSPHRLGWAVGMNLTASRACRRMLLMLRQDVAPKPGAIAHAPCALERDPLLGLASARLDEAGEASALACAALAFVSRDLFDALGGFDERFLLFHETADLDCRVRDLGLRVQCLAHAAGRLLGAWAEESPVQAQWQARSALLFRRKHHGGLVAWLAYHAKRTGHALRAGLAGLQGRAERARIEAAQCALLERAWRERLGGRVSPPQL